VAGSKGTGGGLWLLLLMVGALWMRRRKVNA
jgi:MYXO-CTERM domain-containing protein